MKFSINWLKEFVDIVCSPEELSEALTQAGFEVDSMMPIGALLSGITTAKIASITKHPNADKLVVTRMFDGATHHQIVTGASNIKEGDVVPVSLPGAVLANGMAIKKATLRGVDSFGMLCSEVELGVSELASGIWILPPDTPLGLDFSQYVGLKDTVIEVAILPNRGDCQSMYGLAREIAAIFQKPLKAPCLEVIETEADYALDITVSAPVFCSHYRGRIIYDIQTVETPLWMQQRLRLLGMRPLSFIVDVSNYVLLELGQPLHAFDYDLLAAPQLEVSLAGEACVIRTLEGKEQGLQKDTLMIKDPKGNIAIAGIMGGERSSVHEKSRCIVLETAVFKPGHIRTHANRLGMRTESAIRFEKGVDRAALEKVSNRAAYFLQTVAAAKVQKKGVVWQREVAQQEPLSVLVSFEKIRRFLGVDWKDDQCTSCLQGLGLTPVGSPDLWHIPSWREHDLKAWPDIAEEIARLIGYDQVPSTLPMAALPSEVLSPVLKTVTNMQTYAVANGFLQSINFPMISPLDYKRLNRVPHDSHVLLNPLNPTESILRPALFPSLMKTLIYNQNRQQETLQFFEIGKVFPEKDIEKWAFACLIASPIFTKTYQADQGNAFHELPYLKGVAHHLLKTLGVVGGILLQKETGSPAYFHPKKCFHLYAGKQSLGCVGVLNPKILAEYGVQGEPGYLSLDINAVAKMSGELPSYKPYSKMPHTRRDISFLVPDTLSFSALQDFMDKYKPKRCRSVDLFDYFEPKDINDTKSLTMACIYQDDNKTLSDDYVNKVHDKFKQLILQKLPVSIR